MNGGSPSSPPRAGLVQTLVEATARALAGRDWAADCAGGTALVDPSTMDDPDTVARWAVGRYAAGPFDGLVLGSPHGSAAHLAVAMGVPWLPTAFAAAPHAGAGAGAGAGADAGSDGAWLGVPDAYRRFVRRRLRAGASVVVVSAEPAEASTDPALVAQLGACVGDRGGQLHTIAYRRPEELAAAVADIHRLWLRGCGKTGNRLIVECGRLLDPFHAVRAGLVPYWCETASVSRVHAAQLWLAGCEPFTSVTAVPEATGRPHILQATIDDWRQLPAFATRRGAIDPRVARSYPYRPLAPRQLSRLLRHEPYDLPRPEPLTVEHLDAWLPRLAMNQGLGPPPVRLLRRSERRPVQ